MQNEHSSERLYEIIALYAMALLIRKRHKVCPVCGADISNGKEHGPNCEMWHVEASAAIAAQRQEESPNAN